MASAKKKQDEKNLKTLRELVSRPENKHCFDCKQRGPTYINMTVGSFVCTTCSGMLRGLTPPHRVKSISMATFTPEEIEFISIRGNEYCRKVWLGLCDQERLSKDEQQIKDFMISKYERKRYYVKAAENDFNVQNRNMNKNENGHANVQIPKIPPLTNSSTNRVIQNTNYSVQTNKNNNFSPVEPPKVKNGGNFDDPFSSLNFVQNNFNQQPPPDQQMNFANFDNFDSNPVFSPQNQKGTPENTIEKCPPPPSEDRYAALKALDSMMKSQVVETPQQTDDWGQNLHWPNGSAFDSSGDEMNTSNISNPFSTSFENGWKTSSNFNANPFKTEFSWPNNSSNLTNGFTNQQFNSSKPIWETQTANPFTVGTNGQTSNHSYNPFL